MPKTVVSYKYIAGTNGYQTDFNKELSLTGRFVLPPDLDNLDKASILSAIGATENTEQVPCSDTGLGDMRKLEFIREGGNTMSVGIANRANLVSIATSVKGILDAANSGNNKVVCIKLFGEYFGNLNDEFGVSFDGTTFATSHKAPATALKQNYASGVIAYATDAATTFGNSVIQPIKSITEASDNTFAAQLGTTPTACIGSFLNVQNCGNGRRNPRKHRRFLLTFAISANESESIELPASGHLATDIEACANEAASLQGLYCLGYRGESYSRFHKLL